MINICRIRYYPALCFTNFLHYTGKSPGTQGNIFSAAELVEIAFEHTIVELALLVRLPAKKALKLRVAGNDQHPPLRGHLAVDLAKGAVQGLCLLLFQQPLTVGRVGDDLAVLPFTVQLPHICLVKADDVLYTGLFRVFPGDTDGLGVDVAAPDVIVAIKLLVHGFIGGVQPALAGDAGPFLGVKGAVQARGPVSGDEGGLDGNRAAAAEGIPEGVLAPKPGEQHHGGSQGFPERSLHAHSTVAPLVEASPGGVQVQGALVLVQGKLDLVFGSGFRQRLQAIDLAQPAGSGFFHNFLAIRNGVQLGIQTVALYRKLAVPGDEFLPGQGSDALEKGLEAAGGEGAQLEQHPLAAAEIDIEAGQVGDLSPAQHPAVIYLDVLKGKAAQLVAHQALQAEQTGNGISQHLMVNRPLWHIGSSIADRGEKGNERKGKTVEKEEGRWYTIKEESGRVPEPMSVSFVKDKEEPCMMYVFIAIGVIVLILLLTNIHVVQQSRAFVVERLGAYHATWGVGLHVKLPILDRVAKRVSLKEQVVDFAPQPVITKDNVTMQIDTVIYFQIIDPKLYTYGVEHPMSAIENLTATTLRNIIGDLELDQSLTSRDHINTKMRAILDEATDPWGIKVNRVELKNIIPPREIQDAMEKQMKAERERREAILRAEGEKKSSILVAEGQKESVILDAEAAKQAAILRAEAEKEATIREAEGQAEAILKVQQANADGIRFLKEAGADQSVLTIKSLEAFEKAADGKATKIIIPSEIQGIAGLVKSLAEVGASEEQEEKKA